MQKIRFAWLMLIILTHDRCIYFPTPGGCNRSAVGPNLPESVRSKCMYYLWRQFSMPCRHGVCNILFRHSCSLLLFYFSTANRQLLNQKQSPQPHALYVVLVLIHISNVLSSTSNIFTPAPSISISSVTFGDERKHGPCISEVKYSPPIADPGYIWFCPVFGRSK